MRNTCCKARRLRCPPHHRIDRVLQGLRAASGAIFDHHAEAAGIADAGNRWRRGNENQPVMDRLQTLKKLALDCGCRLPRILRPFLERIERHEYRAGIGRIGKGRPGKSDNIHSVRDARAPTVRFQPPGD